MFSQTIYVILIFNLVISIAYYLRTRCEIPFILALFNIMVQYRLISLQLGYSDWVSFDYGYAFDFNFEVAEKVSNLIVTGATVLIYLFMAFYRAPTPRRNVPDSDNLLKAFVLKNKKVIIIGLIIFSIFELILLNGLSPEAYLSSGSYVFMLKLGNSSFILMLFLIVRYTNLKRFITKLAYFGLFAFLAYLTYSTALRFQFLGWMIPIAYFLSRNIKPLPKVFMFLGGIVVLMVGFSIAGVLRNARQGETVSELVDDGLQRMLIADDINFIDGFIMMYEIYPNVLDFDYGMNHVEIIARPIPRAIWPDKPLAGWFQKYAKKYNKELKTVGFSPTIWGVFYAEMGEFGNFFFGLIWAVGLAYLYRSLGSFNSVLGTLLVGTLLASLLPILRSGDLAGDVAVVLMSYWPLIVFTRRYKKFVKHELLLASIQRPIAA